MGIVFTTWYPDEPGAPAAAGIAAVNPANKIADATPKLTAMIAAAPLEFMRELYFICQLRLASIRSPRGENIQQFHDWLVTIAPPRFSPASLSAALARPGSPRPAQSNVSPARSDTIAARSPRETITWGVDRF